MWHEHAQAMLFASDDLTPNDKPNIDQISDGYKLQREFKLEQNEAMDGEHMLSSESPGS